MQETGAGVVELTYRPTVEDCVRAVRARTRVTEAGRAQTGALFGCAAVVAALVAAMLVTGQDFSSLFVWLWLMAMVVAGHWYLPAAAGRQLHRLFAAQGDLRTTVDDRGVRMISRDSETAYGWPMLTRYTETDQLFVLMSPDKHGVAMAVLPKRGAPEAADVDALRACLDRNAVRV